jgi:hypothetical protein
LGTTLDAIGLRGQIPLLTGIQIDDPNIRVARIRHVPNEESPADSCATESIGAKDHITSIHEEY